MKTILYLSNPVVNFSDEDLDNLLSHARENNKERNVSGMLLYVNNLFFQVLEGEEEDIDFIYSKICKDSRHNKITKILDEPISERLFDVWSMAFNKSTSDELTEAGYFTLEEFKEITDGVGDYDTIKIMRSILEKNS